MDETENTEDDVDAFDLVCRNPNEDGSDCLHCLLQKVIYAYFHRYSWNPLKLGEFFAGACLQIVIEAPPQMRDLDMASKCEVVRQWFEEQYERGERKH